MTASIEWLADDRQLHLRTETISYILRILEDGTLGHLYFGGALAAGRSYRHLGPAEFRGFANRVGAPIAFEYPTGGSGDFRVPAFELEAPDGSIVSRLRYIGHEIAAGKPDLGALPATYVESGEEASTVVITLVDEPLGVEVRVAYTVFAAVPLLARSVLVRNAGDTAVRLRCVMSVSLDLPDADWELVTLSGGWARERHVVTRSLAPGSRSIASRRGASGLEHNPFVALTRPGTDEEAGEAIGASLVYSGNFLAEAEVDPYGTARLRLGIEPSTFNWLLEPGATFQAPEAVIGWSGSGLSALSDAYHRLYRERLARGPWRDRERPILLNSWEATYTSFDQDRLIEIAAAAAELGIELFVLDDGWFGQRDGDTMSLGDWIVDRRKLPDGIDGLAERIGALGLSFGLWIEPEMVSEQSNLFAAHPDWAIGIPGRSRTPSRNQFVLDLSRPEIVGHLYGVFSDLLRGAPISYVKWDMNRNITEAWTPALPPNRQGEFFHRYITGVYDLYRRLTASFPDVLFESCASGGGRFDPGILAFAPQGWTSDDTDAIERLRIQWGTSLAYPLSSMAAHVSAVPNHQVGRVTSLATRAAVAFFGIFGYELDPTALTTEERREIADQVAFYKRWRWLFQRGRFVRLRSPFAGDGNETAWMVVAEDGRTAIVGHYRVLARPNAGPAWLRLRALDRAAVYRVSTWPAGSGGGDVDPVVRGGDELMSAGLALHGERGYVDAKGDFRANIYVLEAD